MPYTAVTITWTKVDSLIKTNEFRIKEDEKNSPGFITYENAEGNYMYASQIDGLQPEAFWFESKSSYTYFRRNVYCDL